MQHTVSQQCFLDTTLYLTLFYATNSFLNRARTAAKRHRDGCQTEAFVLWQRVAIGQPPQSAKVQTREDCQFLPQVTEAALRSFGTYSVNAHV